MAISMIPGLVISLALALSCPALADQTLSGYADISGGVDSGYCASGGAAQDGGACLWIGGDCPNCAHPCIVCFPSYIVPVHRQCNVTSKRLLGACAQLR
jgi:hypothetical protein